MERRLQVQGEERWRKPAADKGLDVGQAAPSNMPDESAWTEVGGPGLRVGVDLVHLDDIEGLYPGAEGIWLTQEEWEEVTRASGQDSCILDGNGTDTENINEVTGGMTVEVRRRNWSGGGKDLLRAGCVAIRSSAGRGVEAESEPGIEANSLGRSCEAVRSSDQGIGGAEATQLVSSPANREAQVLSPVKEETPGIGSGRSVEHLSSSMELSPGLKERLAGRFAAKEAVMKAMGSGLDRIELTDIEILRRPGGGPRVRLRGSALAAWAYCGLERLELSISHHRDYALAVAVGLTAVRL